MNNYTPVKQYTLKLVTQSPVYIGDGKKLNKKEYIQDGQRIYVPDLAKMYQGLISLKLQEKYEDYMLSPSKTRLNQWLNDNKINKNQYKSWAKYQLTCDMERSGRSEIEINTFVKDAYGNPYVPGSSMKGVFRNILLAYILTQDQGNYKNEAEEIFYEARNSRENGKRYLQNNARKLEIKSFHKLKRLDTKPTDINNAVNDIMSCIRISDSRPIDTAKLTICQKIDMSRSGTFKSINTLRECIIPGTEIEFDLTIDDRFPFTIEDIKAAVKNFATIYSKCFYKYFRPVNKDLSQIKVSTVWLGGGAGFVSKTLVYPLLGYNNGLKTTAEILSRIFDNRRGVNATHTNDVKEGTSPHMLKCTIYEGKLYEFGQCILKIE